VSASYWEEAVAIAFEEAGAWSAYAGLTKEQCDQIGESLQGSYENYGMAHYSPPASDRINQIEREAAAKIMALQREFDAYRADAETAVKRALRQHSDTSVSIGKHGEVVRYDGRTTVIQ
jgi:hypothetical protein